MNVARFFIPYRMAGWNEHEKAARAHKMAGAKLKELWTERVANQILVDIGRQKMGKPVFVAFLWIEPNKKRDPDNIIAGKKYILDGMTKHGLIGKDNWSWIGGFDDKWGVDRENPGVYVTVTELEKG